MLIKISTEDWFKLNKWTLKSLFDEQKKKKL